MTGFDWNEFYTLFKVKLEKVINCTVGRYVTPKESQFPYVDVALADNSGGNYDLSGNEGSQNPLLAITVYDTGALADSTCESISQEVKTIMLSYGFQCRGGPMKVVNATDPNIARWVGRYQRVVGSGDTLKQLH